jgi:hypothetical protein
MKTEEKRIQCLNCGNTFKGQFCPHCGQKANTKRLQFVELFKNVVSPFVGGDSKVVNTCRDLFVRPGIMVRNYLMGKRARYYNPLQMFVYVITTYAIVSYVLGVSTSIFDEMAELDLGSLDEFKDSASIGFLIRYVNALHDNKLYGTFFFAFLSVFPYHVFFRTKVQRPDGAMLPLNYTEQFYTQMFHSCLQMMISIILLPVCLIEGAEGILSYIYQIAALVYVVIIYKQLLGIGWMKSTLLNILAIMLTVVLLFVLVVVVLVAAMLIEEAMK